MAKREDIRKILIIGSGPIIIGQACEFDYSGTQACKALRAEGYDVVLVNSNPATIMTDPGMADHTYIEPLTVDRITAVIEKERPDALLPNLGGQTALNLASKLHEEGILKQYGVEVIGVDLEAIARGEDRIIFKETMDRIGVPVAKSEPVYSVEEAEKVAAELGYPVVLRPAYTMGGTGGGIVYNVEELRQVVPRGLAASLINQVLVEECVLGWEELELEVVRDAKGQKITVCFIENVDPMGVHTGDSFCVAPMLTVPQEVQDKLQDYSYRILDAIGVTGGTNVQFAHNREDNRIIVIEINPRTSRSSALASKATGFPIASVSTKLASGVTMDELPYWRKGSLEKYEPYGDYVVVKFARWAFEKFPKAADKLGTQMKAVGEVMSIGQNFKEAFQKAVRSLEIGRAGLGRVKKLEALSTPELREKITYGNSERFFQIYELLRRGVTVEEIVKLTRITPYFIEQMKELADFDFSLDGQNWDSLSAETLRQAKEMGFSDKYLAQIFGVPEKAVRARRQKDGITATFRIVPVSGVEHAEYYYSTYSGAADEVPVNDKKKIMILGGGPNRIGQGIEFDYTCVHAAFTLRDHGYESIMVNCNPETVSTDYDVCDRLYFDELSFERVLDVIDLEQPRGVIVSVGGQIPNNLAMKLYRQSVPVLGTSPISIDRAENRNKFSAMLDQLGIDQPAWQELTSLDDVKDFVKKVGYPVLVRPSYVLSGAAMNVCYDQEELERFLQMASEVSKEYPVVVSQFMQETKEIEFDAVAQNGEIVEYAISEHIEFAGVHSGDATLVFPAQHIYFATARQIKKISRKIAKELNISGPFNIQFLAKNNDVKVIECNLRASRSFPFVSKVLKRNFIETATRIMLDAPYVRPDKLAFDIDWIGVKASQFSFARLQNADPVLGVDMSSTGEVGCLGDDFDEALLNALIATGYKIPKQSVLFSSGATKSKVDLLDASQMLHQKGYNIYATAGTAAFLNSHGITTTPVFWPDERPNAENNVMKMIAEHKFDLIVNIPKNHTKRELTNGYRIRRGAIDHNIPLITNARLAKAFIEAFCHMNQNEIQIKSWQEYK